LLELEAFAGGRVRACDGLVKATISTAPTCLSVYVYVCVRLKGAPVRDGVVYLGPAQSRCIAQKPPTPDPLPNSPESWRLPGTAQRTANGPAPPPPRGPGHRGNRAGRAPRHCELRLGCGRSSSAGSCRVSRHVAG